jgi:hypothetical protein
MTVRRTEVPVGGVPNRAGAAGPMRPGRNKAQSGLGSAQDRGPRKPTLDEMGPGRDAGIPAPKNRPHLQDAREAHGTDFVPLNPEDRARPKPPLRRPK